MANCAPVSPQRVLPLGLRALSRKPFKPNEEISLKQMLLVYNRCSFWSRAVHFSICHFGNKRNAIWNSLCENEHIEFINVIATL